jgi:hypothetical protein
MLPLGRGRPTFWHVLLWSCRQSLLAYHAGLGWRRFKLGRVCGLMLIWKHLHMLEVTDRDRSCSLPLL